jgi:hypothetical protein
VHIQQTRLCCGFTYNELSEENLIKGQKRLVRPKIVQRNPILGQTTLNKVEEG